MKLSGRAKIYLLGVFAVTIGMNILKTVEFVNLIGVLNNIAVYYCESKCFLM